MKQTSVQSKLSYNLNLIRSVLNKHGLRMPAFCPLGQIEYEFVDFKQLSHDLPKYRKNVPSFFTIRCNDDGHIKLEYSNLNPDLVTRHIVPYPTYYHISQIIKRRYMRSYLIERTTVIDKHDSASEVLNKVECALEDMISSWTPVFDLYRSDAYKSLMASIKERRDKIRQINADYNIQVRKKKESLANIYSIYKESV